MDIGIGLPTAVHAVAGPELPGWARAAEDLGFARLGTVDRICYGNYEPLLTLASAAAATSRIRLATTILLAGCRGPATPLAKQLATLQALSGGRLAVGVAAGGREDDFAAAGAPFRGRGRHLDTLINQVRQVWADGTAIPPLPSGPPPILVGGHSPAAMRRAARYGQGWIMGASSVEPYAELAARLRAMWTREQRTEPPLLMAMAYTALGVAAREAAERHLRGYYAQAGRYADRVVASLLASEAQIRETAAAYQEAGCGELILFPCAPGIGQLDLLAKAVLDLPGPSAAAL